MNNIKTDCKVCYNRLQRDPKTDNKLNINKLTKYCELFIEKFVRNIKIKPYLCTHV